MPRGLRNAMGIALQIATITATLVVALTADAKPLTINERLSDFQQLNAYIDSGYGPLEFKKAHLGLNVEKLRAEYQDKIVKARTNGEFFYLLRQYVAAYHDGHFEARVPSRRMAFFPVLTERIQGKVIIDTVLDGMMPGMFPFKRGDEVVMINGRPVADEIKELASYMGSGNPETELRQATWSLFYRPGAMLPLPQSKSLSISVRRAGREDVETINVAWLFQGEQLDEDDVLLPLVKSLAYQSGGKKSEFTYQDLIRSDFFQFSTKNYWDSYLAKRAEVMGMNAEQRAETAYSCNGGTRIQPPRDAVVVSTEPFVAYYHNTPYGKVGYLRVPHYMPQNPDGSPAIEEWFAMYEYAISEFEKNTVGLIIDQDHNCGGYINFANQFVSLFMDKPYTPIKFSLLANKGEYLNFRQWLDMIPRNMLLKSELTTVASAIKTAWDAGKNMTDLISLDGKEVLPPHHIRYTKPVVMLIDSMAGSGGDGVPALMQGLGRAKLLGSQTASMGGHVVTQPPLNYSQIQFSMTKSLFYRPDGTPIENNGAVPDYPYEITLEDFMTGYKGYQAYYLKVLGDEVAKAQIKKLADVRIY